MLAQDMVVLDPSDLPTYAQHICDFYRDNPQFVRLSLWQALERPNLTQTIARVRHSLETKVGVIAEAQKAGLVSNVLSADRLLDHILALTHGIIALAGHPNSWTDEQRNDLGTSVRLLTTPHSGNTHSLLR